MKTTSQKIRTSFISAAAILFAVPLAAQAVTVDGQYNDWNLETDFSMPMYRAGDPNLDFSGYEILSNAYLRYDAGAVYVLVLDTEKRADISESPSDAWVKIYELGKSTLVDGNSGNDGDIPDFVWVTDGQGGVVGWEGSFLLVGSYAGLEIHVNHDNDTSSTGKSNAKGVDQTKTIDTSMFPPLDVLTPPTYSISGEVVIDADLNGPDEGEMGISNVTVELHDDESNVVASVSTSESGGYEFTDLLAGDYSVIVLPKNDILDDFNEILADYFFATTETEIVLTVTEDVVEDFGFSPDVDKVIADIDGVTLKGDGLTIGFWKHQNAVADKGKKYTQINTKTLQGYIDAIEELLLEKPFQFDDANEFRAAHDVMAMRTSDALELLKKQMLGTEFNDVAGRGLEAPFDELQDKLIAWGEYLAANSELFTRDELINAKDIFDLINNSGHM